MTKTIPYDSAEFLTDDETIQEYVNEALATNDAALISHAVGVVARARSMATIAKQTGLSRGSLYKALSPEGKPALETVLKVLGAVGITLRASRSAGMRHRTSKGKRSRKAAVETRSKAKAAKRMRSNLS